MNHLWFYAALGIFLFSCSGDQDPGSEKNQEIALVYFDAAFSMDYEELSSILHEEMIFIGPKISDTTNREGLIDSWKGFHKVFDQVSSLNPECISKGNEVYFYYTSEFHHKDKDIWLSFPLHVRFRFRDNKISFIQVFVNQADILDQLDQSK